MTKQNLTLKVPSASQQVKDDFKEKRDSLGITLPQFTEFVQAKQPDYNNADGFIQIRNVWYCRRADLTLNKMLNEYEDSINKTA